MVNLVWVGRGFACFFVYRRLSGACGSGIEAVSGFVLDGRSEGS